METLCKKLIQLQTSNQPIVKYKENSTWTSLSGTEYFQQIESIAYALKSMSLNKGEPVAIMAQTQFKWAAIDLALLGLGALVVTIYPNNTKEDTEFILNHSKASVLFLENEAAFNSMKDIFSQLKTLKKVILLSGSIKNSNSCMDWNSFLELGIPLKKKDAHLFRDSCLSIELSDPATIIYTSGTTGTPKGVLLTHLQISSEVAEAFSLFGVTNNDVSLSFLPYAHILGRIDHWGSIYHNYLICFAESIERIKNNFLEIQPTFFISVPRIFEKIYGTLSAQLESDRLQKSIFEWAQKIGEKIFHHRQTGQSLTLRTFTESLIADKLVFSRVRGFFGGRLRFAISGGAPLSPKIATFFHNNGIKILEGYGLTETTAAITVNPPYNFKIGTVGLPIGDVKIKIAQDGEILVHSQKNMKEYYLDSKATKDAMNEGWFATGDIGHLLPSGHLQITDRKKDLIKTGGGKYVAPQKLENLLKSFPLLSHIVIHGDQRKYIIALVTLDKENLKILAERHQVTYSSVNELYENQKVYDEVKKIISEANSELASYESIKKFKIIPGEFSIENGELTPSLKVKRKVLEKKFQSQIEELYEP